MLRGWNHSGFNIHRNQRVPPGQREDMERLAQYIIRNRFSVEKMRPNSSGDSIFYRSAMNPKSGRNFEVFSPCDFIARITQHIPDKSFQLVRYYRWHSNKMRGQRPIWFPSTMEMSASSFKLRASAPEGRTRFPMSRREQRRIERES